MCSILYEINNKFEHNMNFKLRIKNSNDMNHEIYNYTVYGISYVTSVYVDLIAAMTVGHSQIMSKLNHITAMLDRMSKRISAIEAQLAGCTTEPRTVTDTRTVLQSTSLPISTIDELNEIEQRLKTD